MSDRQLRISPPELSEFVRQLDRFTQEMPYRFAACRREMERIVGELRRYRAQAEREVAAAEADLRQAAERWQQCLDAANGGCEDLAAAHERARTRRTRAEHRLYAATQRLRKGLELEEQVRGETEPTGNYLGTTGRSAVRASDQLLIQLGQASVLKRTLAEGAIRSSGGSAGQRGGGGSSGSAGLPLPAGFDSLNVNTIPASELAAINPGAFAKMPMDQMQEAIGLLGSRVVPLVSSGATIDDLRRLDSSEGRTGPVTLARTYELFFGSDAIRVDLKGPAPSVINGRHRIWLARQMGVASLPMRVH